jgi:hypothetical protein
MEESSQKTAGDRRFATLVAAAYLPVAVFAMAHHEMWRDEVHCWLVARDSATPWDVVANRAYDGQPPLWYWLLWSLEKTTHDPRSMQVVHLGIATAAVWVFARFAPFGRWARALFPFGYFLVYEYAAICRCYGLALLFALLLCVRHRRHLERPILTALLLAALALTTLVATMVAAGYTAALLVEWLAAKRGRDGTSRKGRWIPVAAAALGGVAAALSAWPPRDSTVAQVRWPSQMPSDDAPTRLIAGLLPFPRIDFFFWNSNALLSFEPIRRVALWVSLLLASWILFLFSRDRAAATLFAVGSALLVVLFGGVYGGDVRHHGFFFVLFIMGAWIAREMYTPGSATVWTRLRQAALTPTLTAVLVVHVAAAAVAIGYDYKYIFSSGRRAADVLRAKELDSLPLVAEVDFPATAVLGQLGPDAWAYTPRTGRRFSFVKWTRDRHWDPTDEQTLIYAAALGASRGQDAILIMNRPLLPRLVDGLAVFRIAELYDSMIEEENFYLYRVRRQRP